MSAFSEALLALRREGGYPSAYRFYHSNGGRRHFGFTYVHYLRLEKGAKAPRAEAFGAILKALRLAPAADGARRMFRAYLLDVLGSPEAYELIVGSVSKSVPSVSPTLAEGGFDRLKRERLIHMGIEQFTAISRDETTYWTSELLLNDDGSWSPKDVADRLECSPKAAAEALGHLTKAKLLRATSPGRWKTRHPGKFWTFPGRSKGMEPLLDRVRVYWDAMVERRGGPFGERLELVRASSSVMRQYMNALHRAVDEANLAATHAKGEDTALFLIEGRVRRLLPF
ncbi:MAG: hypothetical protein PHS14_01570 [Elusimicrobia bacterium]|nr:hypothetical protein [Elusimicrobiota bacterium]